MERIDTRQQDCANASFTLALQTQCATIRRADYPLVSPCSQSVER